MRKRIRLPVPTFLTARCALVVLVGLALLLGTMPASSQIVENPIRSLKTVPTPEPPNLGQFLRSNGKGVINAQARAAAIALGKALFWDQAAGSDGQACASCHYNAGADSRTRNQMDPDIRAVGTARAFTPPFGPDYQLKASDFPLTKWINPDALPLASNIQSDSDNVVSSQGVFNSMFGDILPGPCPDDQPLVIKNANICDTRTPDYTGNGAIFFVGDPSNPVDGVNNYPVRNVEPRNTPTVINAVFNYRNFWDGRARNEFNGVSPIGDLDPYARVLMASGSNTLAKVSLSGSLRLEDASLASQAVGPALSDMEMSAQQRTFAKLGKKMLTLPHALPGQAVALDDSVLGNNKLAGVASNFPALGINANYRQLIQLAFQDRWWNSNLIVTFAPTQPATDGTVNLTFSKPTKGALTTSQYTQMEFNFSLFWGIAIQMYEATLRADDSPMDQAFDSGNPLTFNSIGWGEAERQGLLVFTGQGNCSGCHGGPELTNGSVRNVRQETLERMLMGDLSMAVYDVGFYNTAVRKCVGDRRGNVTGTCDDAGLGATIGPLNLPLSLSRFFQLVIANDPKVALVCQNQPLGCQLPTLAGVSTIPLDVNDPVAVVGAFKTPGLRNIELQAPFMHNGGDLTLLDTVQFYDRGGNFPYDNIANFDPDILDFGLCPTPLDVTTCPGVSLGLTGAQKADLVAFMKALTDERVRFERAPFDHPELWVPNLGVLPAVGRNGNSGPLKTFCDNLPAEPNKRCP